MPFSNRSHQSNLDTYLLLIGETINGTTKEKLYLNFFSAYFFLSQDLLDIKKTAQNVNLQLTESLQSYYPSCAHPSHKMEY